MQQLNASDGGSYAWFGCSVALEDDMALIGAMGKAGAVYVYRPIPEPGTLLLMALALPLIRRRLRKTR